MNAVERRQEIVRLITTNDEAMSGSMLAKELDVSRQVIVQDIALLKAAGYEILSTNKGYVINDVFVWHRVYGKIEAKLNVASRRNVQQCIDGLVSGKSSALMNITSGYHYHTVKADSEETLDLIEKALAKKNYLAPEI